MQWKGDTRQCLMTKDAGTILQTKILLDGKVATDTQAHITRTPVMRQRHTHRDTNTLNPLKEELEMGEAGESEGWERNRRAADGQKDVNPFSFFPDSIRALWVIASRTDVSFGSLHVTEERWREKVKCCRSAEIWKSDSVLRFVWIYEKFVSQ